MRAFIIKSKRKILSILFWIFLWHLISLKINNIIFLPSPLEVFKTLFNLLKEREFWESIFYSSLDISKGFLLGIFFGIVLAVLTYKFKIFKDIFEIPLNLIQSSPLVSLVILILVWFNSSELPIIVVTSMVLPNIYYGTISGLERIDKKTLEMAKVFNIKIIKRIKYIYIKEILESLKSNIIIASSLAWKSGISAEFLGSVKNTIGERLYYSKIYLDTSGLFAWTLTIILLSKLFYLIIKIAINRVNSNEE